MLSHNRLSNFRAWLLPLLQERIQNTNMQYFARYFLPLAQSLKDRAEKAQNGAKPVEAKNLEILYYQVWDLWPSFCRTPVDLADSFKFVAKALGTALTDEPL